MSSNPLVIYHGGCPDGFCAAWVAKGALGNCDFYGAKHGDPPPNVLGRKVYVLDFSYPRAVLEQMHKDAADLLVIDHHQTAEADLSGLPYCLFDMKESGASLSWRHFHPDSDPPWLVRYVRDRDLWLWELPGSREVSAATMAMPRDFAAWDAMAQRTPEEAASIGKGIRDHIQHYIASVMPLSFRVDLDGYSMACANVPYPNVSDVLDAMIDADSPVALAFYWSRDRWAYSLRSRGDIDVSAIAKKHGGGGHKNAAGFQSGCVLLPEILKAQALA